MTKGASPLAPLGRHSSQSGALLDRAVIPVAPDVVPPAVPATPDEEPDGDPSLEADPVVEPPVLEPLGVVAVGAAAELGWVATLAALVVVGRVTAP